jgi:hypothetical protein
MASWLASGAAFLSLALFAFVAALNWRNVLRGLRGRKTNSSIPLVGGISGFIGIIFLAKILGESVSRWRWLPLFLDWGKIPLFI